jgi:hypothetical protein
MLNPLIIPVSGKVLLSGGIKPVRQTLWEFRVREYGSPFLKLLSRLAVIPEMSKSPVPALPYAGR